MCLYHILDLTFDYCKQQTTIIIIISSIVTISHSVIISIRCAHMRVILLLAWHAFTPYLTIHYCLENISTCYQCFSRYLGKPFSGFLTLAPHRGVCSSFERWLCLSSDKYIFITLPLCLNLCKPNHSKLVTHF